MSDRDCVGGPARRRLRRVSKAHHHGEAVAVWPRDGQVIAVASCEWLVPGRVAAAGSRHLRSAERGSAGHGVHRGWSPGAPMRSSATGSAAAGHQQDQRTGPRGQDGHGYLAPVWPPDAGSRSEHCVQTELRVLSGGRRPRPPHIAVRGWRRRDLARSMSHGQDLDHARHTGEGIVADGRLSADQSSMISAPVRMSSSRCSRLALSFSGECPTQSTSSPTIRTGSRVR